MEKRYGELRILIVEDDKKLAGFLKKGLEEENYAVDVCYNGDEGAYLAQENEYDIIILDIMLPKKDGIDVCKTIRRKNITTPIIILTVKNTLEDRIKGLDEGADDYLTKPFSFEELLARIRALLRRTQNFKTKTLKVADLELDPATRIVTRGGKRITLTGKEYSLLEYLMRNKGKILTEAMIIEHVWNRTFDSLTNVVNVYIHHLRQKIDKDFDKKLIHNIHGVGYVMKEEENV